MLFGREFQVWTTLFRKKLSLIVAQEQKLLLTLELKDSLRILRLFPRRLTFGPDISTYFLRLSRFTQSILSLLLKTLYVSIRSHLILLSYNVVKLSLCVLKWYLMLFKTSFLEMHVISACVWKSAFIFKDQYLALIYIYIHRPILGLYCGINVLFWNKKSRSCLMHFGFMI